MAKPTDSQTPCGLRTNLDISTITSALENYRLDNHSYPTTKQGLQALVREPDTFPFPKNWRKNGYLKAIPIDVWGRQLRYQSDTASFEIVSLGQDGKLGGRKCNKDISSENLW